MKVEGPLCAVVIPAFNEELRIGKTVRAALFLPLVDLVVVVDDGSTDGTAREAAAAGASVARHIRRSGKGASLESGVARVRELHEDAYGSGRLLLLFLDADLEDSAGDATRLIDPILKNETDATIAVLPRHASQATGGHGLVVGVSRWGIRVLTSWSPTQPLSGQRCLTAAAFEASRPLAAGFGVETAMTIDLHTRGLRVREVEVPMNHRVTGSDWRSPIHRARQLRDVLLALLPRLVAARRHLAPGSKRSVIVYDDDCSFCRWLLKGILRWDRGRRLRPVALQDDEAVVLLEGMSSQTRMDSWHFVEDGRVYSAGAAVAPLLRVLPGGRLPAALAGTFPGITEWLYLLLANRRDWLGAKLRLGPSSCRIERTGSSRESGRAQC